MGRTLLDCCARWKRIFTEDSLQLYRKQCSNLMGFDVQVMLKVRKAANLLSDEKIERALRFASKIGFGRTLHDIDEIDFQGHTLLRMLRKPSAYATLVYLIALYLPTNT